MGKQSLLDCVVHPPLRGLMRLISLSVLASNLVPKAVGADRVQTFRKLRDDSSSAVIE